MMETREMNALETRGLCRRYGKTVAVENLDLALPQGAANLLIGANGAGKSTTLNLLVGLIRPTAGESRVLGKPSQDLTARDFLQIGYASDSGTLPGHLRLEAWLDYLRPLYPSWDVGLEHDLKGRFQLPAGRPLSAMSRGERMKARLLAALVFRPRLLVLDEPLSGLDPVSRSEVVASLIDLAGEATMLIASHDLGELEPLATHVALMRAGRLTFHEEVDTLLGRFRQVSATASHQISAPPSWLQVCQDNGRITFIDTAFNGDAGLIEALGGVRPEIRPMSLSAIASATMRPASVARGEAA